MSDERAYVVYQSPKPGKPLSSRIAADDAQSRQRLESRGWKLVETGMETVEDNTAPERDVITDNYDEFTDDELWQLSLTRGIEYSLGTMPTRASILADLRLYDAEHALDEDDPPAHPLDGLDFLKPDQRDALSAAGFGTPDALREATDAQLADVKGIGAATIRNLRDALKA